MADPRHFGNPLFGGNLSSDDTESGALALVRIPRTLAGNALTYYQHTVGKVSESGQRLVAPKNARGRLGHDHTGAGFGRPIQHTWYQYTSTIADFAPDISRQGITHTQAAGAGVSDTYDSLDMRSKVYVPACHNGTLDNPGAYRFGKIEILIYVETASTNMSSTGLWFDVYTEPGGISAADANYLRFIINARVAGWSSQSGIMPFVPGRINDVRFHFHGVDAGNDATFKIDIPAISISQED